MVDVGRLCQFVVCVWFRGHRGSIFAQVDILEVTKALSLLGFESEGP